MSRFDASLLQRAGAFLGAQLAAAPEPPRAPIAVAVDALTVAKALIRRFEGLYLTPYLCPAGVPTIGYGATYYEDGTRVTLLDLPISRHRAEQLLNWHVLNVYLPAVRRLCPGIDTPERLAAIIDFAFNLGGPRLQGSTLRLRINAGRWDDVPFELRKWVMAGGRRVRGLELRREAEAVLIPSEGGK